MPIDVSYAALYQTDGTNLTSDDIVPLFTYSVTSPLDSVPVGGTVTLTTFIAGTPLIDATVTVVGQSASGELQLELPGGAQVFLSDNSALSNGSTLPAIDTSSDFVCFAAGTLIATPQGDIAVDQLQPGDTVLTSDGQTARVRWIGHQTRSTIFGDPARVCPVRIAAGALAENVPTRDLTVTGDHGIVFDEAIVHASALVNGTTITRVAKALLPKNVTYYHVETEGHVTVLAEGCPAETFIDNVSRELFDNYDEFVAAFGDEQEDMAPLDLPRAKGPRQVPVAIKSRVAERSAQLIGQIAATG